MDYGMMPASGMTFGRGAGKRRGYGMTPRAARGLPQVIDTYTDPATGDLIEVIDDGTDEGGMFDVKKALKWGAGIAGTALAVGLGVWVASKIK